MLSREILSTGGATVNLATGARPRDGWAVSLAGAEQTFPADSFGASELAAYAARHGADLRGADRHLGAWLDGGTVYLDVSIIVADRAAAERLGRLNAQLAVYCLATGQTVPLAAVPA